MRKLLKQQHSLLHTLEKESLSLVWEWWIPKWVAEDLCSKCFWGQQNFQTFGTVLFRDNGDQHLLGASIGGALLGDVYEKSVPCWKHWCKCVYCYSETSSCCSLLWWVEKRLHTWFSFFGKIEYSQTKVLYFFIIVFFFFLYVYSLQLWCNYQ